MSYVLTASSLTKVFRRRGQPDVVAVDEVSFAVGAGASVALVGSSGSGKSTVARLAVGLMRPTKGSVTLVEGPRQRQAQMVFQQPARSFDPRRTLGAGAAEGLRNLGVDAATARDRVCALFERCGLETSLFDRYPHEVSGGQCQRAAIARALAPDPALVVLDEATSALDVTVQARVMDLLRELRAEREVAYLFICHDLALVQGFADRTIVLDHGRVAEEGPTADLLRHPTQPATAALVEAARALHGM